MEQRGDDRVVEVKVKVGKEHSCELSTLGRINKDTTARSKAGS